MMVSSRNITVADINPVDEAVLPIRTISNIEVTDAETEVLKKGVPNS